ncbi:MAG: hypothetical protein ABJF50_18050 [Paracoccaceae bacterium]
MAVLKRLREKALKGDQRALDLLLKFAEERSDEKEAQQSERALSRSEEDILSSFADVIRREERISDTPQEGSGK